MNPILLKPTAGVGAQVTVHGKVSWETSRLKNTTALSPGWFAKSWPAFAAWPENTSLLSWKAQAARWS